MNFISEVSLNFADSMLVLLIGMLLIFTVVTILILVVLGYVRVFKVFSKKGNAPKKPTRSDDEVEDNYSSDTELVAAITAAICCVLSADSDEEEAPPFIIKSIKKVY